MERNISAEELTDWPKNVSSLIKKNKSLIEKEDQIKQICEKLDKKSKAVYLNRVLFNYTLNYEYLIELVKTNDKFVNMIEPTLEFWGECESAVKRGEKLIFYGVGSFAQSLAFTGECFFYYQVFDNIDWCCFVDKDKKKQGQLFCGKPVISPEQLIEKHADATVVIGTPNYQLEVEKELIGLGIKKEKILMHPSQGIDLDLVLDPTQYFDDFILGKDNEIFVDAGCYVGDTIEKFLQWNHGNYEKIYAFEPDKENFKKCEEYLKSLNLDNIKLWNAGLYSSNGTISFKANGNSGSHISQNEENKIDVLSLDECLKGEKVTFIKMDIEGSELEALKGAKETIKKWRPKLAICLYHKKEDVFEIPAYLLELVDDYQIHVRHYSNFGIETVLYAI